MTKNNNSKWDRWWVFLVYTMAVAFLGAGIAWGMLKNTVTIQNETIANHEVRVRDVEIVTAKIEERLINIQNDVTEIKEMIKQK